MEQRTVKGTQKERILDFLKNNPHLSSKQAREELGVKNLRARMDEIRKAGVKVFTDTLPGGGKVYRLDKSGGTEPPPPANVGDMKEQFAQAIKQVLEEKGMLLNAAASTPIRQRLDGKGQAISDAIQDDVDIDTKISMVDNALTAVASRLKMQGEIIDGLTNIIKKSAENVKRYGELDGQRDVKRNSELLLAAREIRKELEGISVSAAITSDDGRKKNTRQDGLRGVNLTAKNAKITIEGSAKFDMLAPQKPVQRMSGIDKDTKKERSSVSSSSSSDSGIGGGILKGLVGLAIGGALASAFANKELREKITGFAGEVISGTTEKIIENMVPLSKKAASSLWETVKENPAMTAFGLGGVAGGASAVAKKVGQKATNYGFTGVAAKAGVASAALKTGARRLPMVGGLIDYGMRRYEGQSVGRAATGAGFATAGQIIGGGLGTILGPMGIVGGAALGGWLGGHVGDGVYNYFNRDEGGEGIGTNIDVSDIDGNKPPSQLKPEESQRYTFNYLKQNGFTDEQAAGIIGNIMTETSGFKAFNNPDDKTASGVSKGRSAGIVQWNGPRLEAFKKMVGKDPLQASLKEQLDFMMWEMRNSERASMDAVKKTNTAKDAALEFERTYERSAKDPEHMRSRVSNAEKVLKQMKILSQSSATMSVPQTPKFLQNTSTPLNEVKNLADVVNSPTIIMPQSTTINAPSTSVSKGSGGSHVVTVRDSTTPFTRNADKHNSYNFAR